MTVERCRCGFAGTNVTLAGHCALCDKLVDVQSMRWLVEQALTHYKRGQ
jgi:hypothetical protein